MQRTAFSARRNTYQNSRADTGIDGIFRRRFYSFITANSGFERSAHRGKVKKKFSPFYRYNTHAKTILQEYFPNRGLVVGGASSSRYLCAATRVLCNIVFYTRVEMKMFGYCRSNREKFIKTNVRRRININI